LAHAFFLPETANPCQAWAVGYESISNDDFPGLFDKAGVIET